MKKLLALLSTIAVFRLFFPSPVFAVCPVCTIAVGAGLGISKTLGIDDTVTSVWIGGLILSSSLWISDWLVKREKFKKYSNSYIIAILMYAIVLTPLYYSKLIGVPFNTLWGIDKILAGTAIGSGAFLLGVYLDKRARELFGKQFFPFQKVVFPVSLLLSASLILYFVTN